MARPCIVVAGMGRCGTSLTMQMLDAVGIPCIGDWPDFETDASSVGGFDPGRFGGMSDCAIKIVDPSNLMIGDMPNHVVIWLDRDARQQAKSQAKLLSLMGLRLGRNAVRTIQGDLRKSRDRHRARVGIPGGCPSITLRFEGLITDRTAVTSLSRFLAEHGWDAPAEKMAAQIRPRPTDCLPGFLEETLLEQGRAA